MPRPRRQIEFGDFQTPRELAESVCRLLLRQGCRPRAVVEPTCGLGSFLRSALDCFPSVTHALGYDVNADYLPSARQLLADAAGVRHIRLRHADFFHTDWGGELANLPEPLLVLGNPPWITNAELGALGSENLPAKSNFQQQGGWDAISGKSNFDISEWLLIRLLEALQGRLGTLAMLCKVATARRVLQHAWKAGLAIRSAELYEIDAQASFGARVAACLLVCDMGPGAAADAAEVYSDLEAASPQTTIGWRDRSLVAEPRRYDQWRHLAADEKPSRRPAAFRWRSGIKHDCAKVMELRRDQGVLRNGWGEEVLIEPHYVYPLLKSSEVAGCRAEESANWLIVTQRSVQAETESIRKRAPRTWDYLLSHAHLLDGRRSSIYRQSPRFAVFGVGDYTFAPYKVAISGFYKRLEFQLIGPRCGLPVVFDDTVYFLACPSREEAERWHALLNSNAAREFYSSFIFWDAKRPITADLLNRLDLRKLAAYHSSKSSC